MDKMMPGKPYLHLYIGDWRKDPAVQSLDYEHRGIWMEMLMFMDQNEDRGRLTLDGRAMSDDDIANMLGLTLNKTKRVLSKLLANQVASVDGDGAIINRRMVREAELSRKRSEAGSKGGKASGKQIESKDGSKTEAGPDYDYDSDIDSSSGGGGEGKAPDYDDEIWKEEYWEGYFEQGVDTKKELFMARNWIEANPSRRKKNYKRFLTNWMNKALKDAPEGKKRFSKYRNM